MLGFDGALDAPGSAMFGGGSGDILLAYAGCEGTEDNLADCAHNAGNKGVSCRYGKDERISCFHYDCSHAGDAGAICYSGAHPQPFQVRLIGGSNDAEGRVEFLNDGSWGTICDDLWDLRDARVVCRMLGFDGALDAPGSARFGKGSGDILIDDVGSHPNSFGIRLVGGASNSEGRVEVCTMDPRELSVIMAGISETRGSSAGC
ncbi:deleted in malignant brain tumors 1 protein-like [Strongylocentrotus purpuratus]|uniref:SRCR domain-containing protein n=1 Tax=Strongylocentrotus purpuratus TaxID=7668 RepID=A0A7M7HQ90_STRPU|nr:deleted in malignant brain tumors 1 protein-like [Strongylocentrotus purpuratus]|eukprot:XP_011683699.1 PREDICTED: deleted in malignant brain tumors 1 protein-like [Strongylocentrotus purpuratus]